MNELSYSDCSLIINATPFTAYSEENSILLDAQEKVFEREDEISRENFLKIEDKIKEIRKSGQIINIYEIAQIINSTDITWDYKKNAIKLLFQDKLKEEEQEKAVEEFVDFFDFGYRYDDEEWFLMKYFTRENGFDLSEKEKQSKEDNQSEINNQPAPDSQLEIDSESQNVQDEKQEEISVQIKPKQTFFRKFINKIIGIKGLTWEDIKKSETLDKSKEEKEKIE